MSTPSIQSLWDRIHAFAEANAPAMVENLNGPVDQQDLDALTDLAVAIPQSLRTSLAIHDGEGEDSWGSVFPGARLLSAAEILAIYRMLLEVQEQLDEVLDEDDLEDQPTLGPVRPLSMNPGWIPILDFNGDLTWFIDFDPAPGGTPGQVIRTDQESLEWIVCADSFEAFLADYADALEAGEVPLNDEGLPDIDGHWPPLERIPALAGPLDATALFELGSSTGNWALAESLAERADSQLSPDDRLRLSAHAHAAEGNGDVALEMMERIRADGSETEDDLLFRIDLLEGLDDKAQVLAELGLAIERGAGPSVRFRRAQFYESLAQDLPSDGELSERIAFATSPAGQQQRAINLEQAMVDYDAAIVADPRIEWRLDRAACLCESERWEEAEQAYGALCEELSDLEQTAEVADWLELAQEGVERAHARGEGEDADPESLLESLDGLLSMFEDTDMGSEAISQLREIRSGIASLAQERAGLEDEDEDDVDDFDFEDEGDEDDSDEAGEDDPESLDAVAQSIAEQLAERHADIPEAFAPFDPSDLTAKARNYYDRARSEVEALGFTHLGDVEPLSNTRVNGNSVLLRVLRSADGRSVAAVWRLSAIGTTIEAIEFESLLDDGSIVITTNTGSANPFTSPAAIRMQSLPLGSSADTLWDLHQRRLSGDLPAPRVLDTMQDVLDLQECQRQIKREHARSNGWVSEQELRGLLGGAYRQLGERVREQLAKLLG